LTTAKKTKTASKPPAAGPRKNLIRRRQLENNKNTTEMWKKNFAARRQKAEIAAGGFVPNTNGRYALWYLERRNIRRRERQGLKVYISSS